MGNQATCLAQPVLPQQVAGCWGCGSSGLSERSRQFDHRQPFRVCLLGITHFVDTFLVTLLKTYKQEFSPVYSSVNWFSEALVSCFKCTL